MPRTADPRVPRRRFLKTVGLAGVSSALVAATGSIAQAPPAGTAREAAPAVPAPAPPDSAQAATAPEISEEARSLAALIEKRYGKSLTKEQVESIAKDFDGDLKSGRRMSEFKLANGDEPDFTFRA